MAAPKKASAAEGTGSDGSLGRCPACKMEGVRLKEVNGLLICEKCSSKRFSNKVRKGIQEAFERQEEQRRKEAWHKRIELAKRGMKLFDQGKLAEALRLFRDYITILENRFSVGQGGLNIGVFDLKKDAGEMLLVAGIYWDMAKIYDHMKGHQAEMRNCLNKFIEFSIDRPHVILASEAIRKYLASGRCVNQNDFKNAHLVVMKNLSRCFIATAVFGPSSSEVATLRAFRDQYLAVTQIGRRFISAYYKLSPPIAIALIHFRPAARILQPTLRFLTGVIRKLFKV